tara:strand:- start:2038 stop:3504 length:1467 start_codon:yes stop_codon:yes gene_type:complete
MSRELNPIPKYFRDKFPNLSDKKANKYWLTYLNVLTKYTMKPYVTLNHKMPINFPYGKARDECSTFKYQKKRYSIWAEFGAGAGIIQLITKGSNLTHKNSEILIKDTRHLQWALDTQDKKEIISLYYGDCDDTTEFDIVHIDYLSLTHYIRKTEDDIANTKSQALKTHLDKILSKAKTIKLISEYFYPLYNDHVLPQIISTSSYGRRYYKGINLQFCNKILRHACLGKCNEYDLATAVYGIKLMVAKHIADYNQTDWNTQYPRTKQYIEHKELIRETLAEYITVYSDGKKLIKQVITAVGFGATISSPAWNGSAIASIVKNKQERIALLKDEWLIEFIEEQKQLTDTITSFYLNDTDFIDSIKDMDKMNKKQLMAYIFQTLEYQIMNAVCEHIPDKLIQLRVHDAVYTRSPIFANDIQEIKLTLESICPYITLEHNKDSSAKGGDRHSKFKYSPSTEEEIIEHKQLIRQEETLAKDYENIYLSQSINY